MDLARFRQRLQNWYRQEKETFLYYLDPAASRTAPRLHPALRCVVCDRHTLDGVRATFPGLPASLFERVEKGDIAFLAVRNHELVFRAAAVPGARIHHIDGYPLELSATSAFIHYGETVPHWRGKGVAPSMLRFVAHELAARGIMDLYLSVRVENAASRRAVEKGGGRLVGRIVSRRRLGRWQATFQPIVRVSEG